MGGVSGVGVGEKRERGNGWIRGWKEFRSGGEREKKGEGVWGGSR